MKNKLMKLLSALLIASMLIVPVALMEAEPVAAEAPVDEVTEVSAEAVAEADDALPEVIVEADAVDAVAQEHTADLTEGDSLELTLEPEPEIAEAEPMLASGIDINKQFPDVNLRQFILDFVDTDADKGYLSAAEINAVEKIKLFEVDPTGFSTVQEAYQHEQWKVDGDNDPIRLNVSDLSGIEIFTSLKSLDCTGCPLQSLNISKNTALTSLECADCQLQSLDISQNTALTNLNCDGNPLTSLNVSNNTALTMLHCNGCGLTSLDVSKNTALYNLWCNGNKLSQLSLKTNVKLADFACIGNNLTELDISACTALRMIHCKDNPLTSLNIYNCPKLLLAYNAGINEESSDETFVLYELLDKDDIWDYMGLNRSTEILTEEPAEPVEEPDTSTDTSTPADTSTSTDTTAPADTSTSTDTAAPASTATAAPAPAAEAPAPTPTIAAVRRNGRATVYAAPGTVYQLDLGGATGKSFKSSNKKVATVTQSGLVTFKKKGKVKITFKVNKKKRTLTLTVKDPTIPTAVYLDKAGTLAAKVGESQTVTAAIPEGTVSGIKWKSSNKKIATVDQYGNVTFKKKGKVTITATATRGKKKAKVKFKVSK